MSLLKDYLLIKVSFESNDYKNLFESEFIKMSISRINCDKYIVITARKGLEVMTALEEKKSIPIETICTKEIKRSLQSNFKFDLDLYLSKEG